MNRLLTSRMAAHAEIRQVKAYRLAEAAADAADRAVTAQWRALLLAIKTPLVYRAREDSLRAMLAILPAARSSIGASLDKIAAWSYKSARGNLQATMPLGYFQSAAVSRFLPRHRHRHYDHVRESVLIENDPTPSPDRPGILELLLRAIGSDGSIGPGLSFTPGEVFASDPAARRSAFAELLFPPPPRHVVDSIVYAPVNGRRWDQRLEGATRTSATPQMISEIVAQGVAAGETQQQIGRRLLPAVDGIRSTARRLARTEGLRVAQTMQVRAWEGLGDMLIGYQIRAVLDERTRREHRLRNGVIYYKEPRPGQKSIDECPMPPIEADGSIAWNCRCTRSPVLSPPDYLDASAVKLFRDNASMLVPDPLTYSDWFSHAGERDQRLAVGTRRFSAARDILGGVDPSYEHFVDPDSESGDLLSIDRLRSESAEERVERLARVSSIIRDRGDLIRQVKTLGLLN